MTPNTARTSSDEAALRRLTSLRSAIAPILEFLEDDTIVEVMLNADGRVWVDQVRRGMWCTEVRMAPEQALRMLRMVAAEMGRELNAEKPRLSAKLPHWHARVQASIPPIVEAPTFALRKPPKLVFTLDDYVARGILGARQAELLANAVIDRKNIVVAGGTGSGKTTLLNALLQVVSTTNDRVYIVEDTPELQCPAPNKEQHLVQPPLYTHQEAIMDALRYRPDRIIVGEVRDAAALDLLKAWNTGHTGGLASLHANDTRSTLSRLCQLIEEAVFPAPKQLVAEAVHVCVHITRDARHPEGRRLNAVDRVCGVAPDGSWALEPLV